MENYKPNSHKSKEEQHIPIKKIEKVITGSAKHKKKNEIRKFTDVFISEDVGNVKSYILIDILVPTIKKAISDIVTNGIDMILYGETGRTKKDSVASKISYRNYYDKTNVRNDYEYRKSGYNFDDIILDTRGEAENVLYSMEEVISTCGMVSVADLYDMVGVIGKYTDNKYGWTDVRNASVVRVKDGYMLNLPKARPLI